jgi:hypothetical protein
METLQCRGDGQDVRETLFTLESDQPRRKGQEGYHEQGALYPQYRYARTEI